VIQARWRRLQRDALRLLTLERGAVLWIPAVLLAGLFLLLGMRLAPSESAGFTQSHELILVLGPMQGMSDEPQVADEFRHQLRSNLEQQQEFSLVPEEQLLRRMNAMLAPPLPDDPLTWIRATRNFKARYYLAVQLTRLPEGDLQANLEIWEASQEHAVDRLRVQAHTASAVGKLLADSLTVTLFEPTFQRSAHR
jgi:hypothetical protein